MKITKFLLSLTVALFLTNSCRKDDATLNVTPDQETTQLSGKAEFTNENDTEVAVDAAFSGGDFSKDQTSQSSSTLGSCASVTVQTTNGGFPKTYVIDFGTAGCTINGITRKGKLILNLTDKVKTPGSTLTIERRDYYVNDDHVEGRIVYKNLTTLPTVPTWGKKVTGGKITRPDGSYIEYTTDRKQRMIAGFGTPEQSDDVFEIFEGTHHVVRNNGNYLDATITSSLIKSKACPYISRGILTLKGTHLNGTLNYGNGDCDDKATYTDANGNTFVITIH